MTVAYEHSCPYPAITQPTPTETCRYSGTAESKRSKARRIRRYGNLVRLTQDDSLPGLPPTEVKWQRPPPDQRVLGLRDRSDRELVRKNLICRPHRAFATEFEETHLLFTKLRQGWSCL